MKLLTGELTAENKMLVKMIYNLDAPENVDIDTSIGVVVNEESPAPPPKIGVWHEWYINPQTKEQWFEEKERPLTNEERILKILEQQQAQIDQLVLDSLMGGGSDV